MQCIRFIVVLALVLMAQTAAKADPSFMNATAHVISLVFVNGGIEERREQKPFDTYDICLAWKHQKEFLPPVPPAFASAVYCDRTNIGSKAEGTAADVARSDPSMSSAVSEGRQDGRLRSTAGTPQKTEAAGSDPEFRKDGSYAEAHAPRFSPPMVGE
jgi:hypothetical protein